MNDSQKTNAHLLQELTQLRRRVAELEGARYEHEELIHALANTLPDLLFVVDENGRFLEILTGQEHLLYADSEKMKGRLLHEVLPRADADLFLGVIRSALETGELQVIEYGRDVQAGRRYFEGRLAPLAAVEEETRKVICVSRDITQRRQAEDTLRQAEKRYRQLFEEAPVIYVITRNQEGQPIISDCNRQFLTALGYSREGVVNRSLADFYTPESRAEVLEKGGYHRALEGHFVAEERQLMSRNGRVIETLLRAMPEFDAEGRVTGTRAMFLDITERKQAESLLRQTSERLNLILDNLPLVVYELDTTGRWVFSRGKGLEKLGRLPDEVVGKSIFEVYQGRPAILEAVRQALAGQPQQLEVEVNGYYWLANYIPMVGASGKVERVFGTAIDITGRKQAEETLRESEQRFRQLAEHVREVFWMADPRAPRMIYISPAYEEVWGRTCQSLYAQPRSFLEAIHPEDQKRVIAALERQGQGEDTEEEYRVVRADGSIRWIRDRGFPIRDERGQVYRVAGIAEDITQRKRQEQQKDFLYQVREVVWRMKQAKDIEQALLTIGSILTAREISFLAYSINLVEAPEGDFPVQVYIHDPDGRQFQATLRRDQVETRIIFEAWRSEKVLYRPDLAKENIYGEHLNPQPPHEPVRSVIDVPFSRGTLALASARPGAYSEEDISFLKELAGVLSEGFRRVEDLQALEVERRRTEKLLKVNLALQRVRNEILQMAKQQDWEEVALACRRELDSLVSFAGCSIVLVDRQQGTGVAYYCPGPGEVSVSSYATIHPLLIRTVESKTCTYRRTRAEIDRGEERVHSRIKSVIDVPFEAGTLAVNSTEEEAFDEEAIHILGQFAHVLSEGFRRLQDLQALEAERKQAEGNLKLSLALQQVRNKILQMQDEENWQHIVDIVQEQLQPLVPFNACSVNLVDWVSEKSTVHYLQANGTRLTVLAGLPPAFKQVRETGKHVYRHNQAEMSQYEDKVQLFEQQIHSVVDVPFTGGTLAINSLEESAFGTHDIDILEQFAQVLSEAHRRLQDLQALEEKEAQLRQAQKLEAIGQLAGGVAHDFNNLLTIVSGYSEVLERRLDPQDPGSEYLQEIQKAADRGAGLVRQLLAFSRKQVLQPTVLNLNIVVADLGKMLQRLIGEDIELKLVLDPALGTVQADQGQIEQVLLNLVVNARDAMPQGGKLVIETANVELDASYALQRAVVKPGLYSRLSVSDTGVGMDKETQARVFEPFFTTKETGKGTGLGLATVYGIIKQSGGYIWVYSEPEQGTSFKIYLSRTEEADQPEVDAEIVRSSSQGTETILLVEDEEAVRRLMALALREQGYAVLEAGGGEEALKVGSQHAGPIHLLVTDVVMPGMNGQQLAERLAASQGEMKVLFMSGYTEGIIEQHGILTPQVAFLQKPFTPDRLALKAREVLDSAR